MNFLQKSPFFPRSRSLRVRSFPGSTMIDPKASLSTVLPLVETSRRDTSRSKRSKLPYSAVQITPIILLSLFAPLPLFFVPMPTFYTTNKKQEGSVEMLGPRGARLEAFRMYQEVPSRFLDSRKILWQAFKLNVIQSNTDSRITLILRWLLRHLGTQVVVQQLWNSKNLWVLKIDKLITCYHLNPHR